MFAEVLHSSTGNTLEPSRFTEMKVVHMSYNMQKNLLLLAVYATSILVTAVAVRDLSRGFGLATAGWVLLYVGLKKLNS